MAVFRELAIDSPDDLRFGHAPRPLDLRRGMILGGGTVYPELNFTLPPMTIDAGSIDDVLQEYRGLISAALRRAVELEVPGLIVEFETLPPMTAHPDWGMGIVEILLEALEDAHARHGLRTSLRITPNDNREFIRPPRMRSGRHLEEMEELFERSAAAGAELLSIESVGGKEVHDEALLLGDLGQILFALCVLGVRDMRFLWTRIVAIAERHGVHAAGDTACGFANTAMMLAHQGMIPRVLAAVVRAVAAVRSLVAYECGAVGPGKDCGYENPILKAITGRPMAMEGKSAACAHPSSVGNLAAAACDTWSNESVQNIKLLGGMAPTCFLEMLAYDCRLMNRALAGGRDEALLLRRWLVESDMALDPQAWVLTPDSAVRLGRAIVEAGDPYRAGRAAAATALDLLEEGYDGGELHIPKRELPWITRLRRALEVLPDDEATFVERMLATVDRGRCLPEEYGFE